MLPLITLSLPVVILNFPIYPKEPHGNLRNSKELKKTQIRLKVREQQEQEQEQEQQQQQQHDIDY